jgi:ABC-type nitrate/sulfonate/bicarbonate transport system permease component
VKALVRLSGVLGVLLLWELLAITITAHVIPTPDATIRQLHEDGWAFYGPNIRSTGWEALRGFFWGDLMAIALAVVVILAPPLERIVTQIGVISYCLPVVAVGPILTVLLNGDAPMVAMAALLVFFTTLIGVLAGLRAADRTSLDLVLAYGGGRWMQLLKVRLIAALPSSFAALKIAAPSAVLGAIIGEFLGQVDSGLGPAMVIAQQQLQTDRTWGIALVSGALAASGYGVVALVARFAIPWERAT